MAVDSIYLNNKKISFAEIKNGSITGVTEFEQSTLGFCRQWLNGQGLFSLKTSGSTGAPKSIVISRYQMQLSAQQTIAFFDLKSADTVLVCLNTAYIAGIMMLVRAFESKAQIIAVEPSGNPLQTTKETIDFIAVVPLQLQQILNHPASKKQLDNCRAVIVGGAPVSLALEEKIKQSAAKIFATFAMTETLTHFALRQLNPVMDEFFVAFDDVIIGQDSRGCLTVSSAVTEDQKVVTNDLVEVMSTNTFKWLGRIDNVINSGGIKLQIEDLERKVEKAFHDLGLSNRFFIGAMADNVLGEKMVLVVESASNLAVLTNLDWAAYLDKYERPKEVFFRRQFSETPTGKIDRLETFRSLPE
jgi:o-succinylbenzoate---CoA ligase